MQRNQRSSEQEALRREHRDLSDLEVAFSECLPVADLAPVTRSHIVVFLTEAADWMPWLASARALLDTEEAARVERRRFDADRNALTVAYALHRLLLATALNTDPAAVPLFRDGKGAPRLHGRDLYTSLSHAGGRVAVAITATAPVGVDIEPIERATAMTQIADSVCSPMEAFDLRGIPDADRDEGLLDLWIKKESLLKAAGLGLVNEMRTFAAAEGLPDSSGTTAHAWLIPTGTDLKLAVASASTVPWSVFWLDPAVHRPTDETHGR